MYLYNIHTHKLPSGEGDYTEKCILSTSPQEYIDLVEYSQNVWYSCGIHPWYAANADSQIALLEKIALDKRIIAIGEAGLDKLKGADLNVQIEVFRKNIELAIRLGKPLIVHCVKAWDELISLRKEYGDQVPWIIHGYRGNAEQTKQFDKQGFKFSIGEYFNEESVKNIPIESLFCETDTLDVSICNVYGRLCEVLEMDIEQFDLNIRENIEKIFSEMTK